MKRFLHKCFVSSTFVDFHGERDEILHKIYPAFRAEAIKHGTDSELIELRWGVDNFHLEEEALVSRVVGVCLKAVDDSRPAMLIYIGNRFGWTPPREWISTELASKFELDEIDGQSVTALEIIYGLRKSLESPRCVICMRDLSETNIPEEFHSIYFESDITKHNKLIELKEWLRKNFSDKIIDYTADFDIKTGQIKNFRVKDKNRTPLAQAVTEKLIAEFSKDWREYDSLPWTQRALVFAKNFIVNNAELFVGRERLIDSLKATLESSHVVFLRGVSGSGKTSIACKLAHDLLKSNKNVCFITCGNLIQNSHSKLILQQMIFFLEHEVLHVESSLALSADYEQSKNNFFCLCQKISSDNQVYLFFDAVETIIDESRRTLDFIPTAQNIHCLVTCTNDFDIPSKFFNPATKLQNIIDTLDDEAIIKLFFKDEHVDNVAELEGLTRNKISKFFKLFFSKNDDQLQELFDSLPNDLVRHAIEALKKSPAVLNLTMPLKFLTKNIPELEINEIVPVLQGMLDRKGKTLYSATAKEVLKHNCACNPLWLKMVEILLNMIESEELLDPQIRQNANLIVNLTVDFVKEMPDEPAQAVVYVLNKAIEKLCLNNSAIHEAIYLLCAAHNGLRLNDLRDIIGDKFILLDWMSIQLYLHDYFVERDGNQLIDFAHNLIKTGIRASISDDEFAQLEKKIADYIELLAPNDSLRRIDGMYYAKLFNKYEFAVELFAQAFCTKDALLSAEIYYVLCEDNGAPFVMRCFRNLKKCDEEIIKNALSFFIGDYFDRAMIGGSRKTLQFARDIYNFFSETFVKSNDISLYQGIRSAQAMYELRLNNIENAKKIYEEIIRWGKENHDRATQNLESCRTLSTCYDMLAEFSARNNDLDKAQVYAEHCVAWSKAALQIDTTSDKDKYIIISTFKQIALEIRRQHNRATKKILEDARKLYLLCKKALKEKPENFIYLCFICKACSMLINVSVSLNQPKAVLLLMSEEGEGHIQNLLQYDANNLEAVKISVCLFRDIVTAQFKAYNFRRAVENSIETMRLINQIYFQNPLEENAKLLKEISEEFQLVAYESYYEIIQLYSQEPTEENQKILIEASEALEGISNNEILIKMLSPEAGNVSFNWR